MANNDFDVFISYSSKEPKIADALVAYLEQQKIRCWIAPRDIPAGQEYAEEIVDAISQVKVFVLIFSAQSSQSKHVPREIELADQGDKFIIPFRIDNTPLKGKFRYYLLTRQWIDATAAPETHFPELAEAVGQQIGDEPGAQWRLGLCHANGEGAVASGADLALTGTDTANASYGVDGTLTVNMDDQTVHGEVDNNGAVVLADQTAFEKPVDNADGSLTVTAATVGSDLAQVSGGTVANDGTVEANGNDLVFSGATSGSGTIADAGASVVYGANAGTVYGADYQSLTVAGDATLASDATVSDMQLDGSLATAEGTTLTGTDTANASYGVDGTLTVNMDDQTVADASYGVDGTLTVNMDDQTVAGDPDAQAKLDGLLGKLFGWIRR